jgi:hypothetical protein
MSKFIFTLSLLYSICSFSQKSKIIYLSNLKHNYALGKDYYVEDAIDTTRLLFMGVIQITSSNQDAHIINANQLLKTKTKELNGNAYRLKSFETKDTTLTLLFDIYFAPDKQVELIKQNKIKEKIIVFNNYKDTNNRKIYVNNKKCFFKRNKSFVISKINSELQLKLDSAEFASHSITLEKNETAIFYTIKLKDDLGPLLVGAALGVIVGAAIIIDVKYEGFSKLNYNTGRILMEIYLTEK